MKEDEGHMNISGDTPHLFVESSPYQTRAVSSHQAYRNQFPEGGRPQTDQLNLSSTAREIQQVRQMLAQGSETRETRIAALKHDVESGHYQIRAEQVAEKIAKDHLLNLLH
jgi:flagellar biosynthesis anti-sigma factor FlgM